jgi:hypothetical protein
MDAPSGSGEFHFMCPARLPRIRRTWASIDGQKVLIIDIILPRSVLYRQEYTGSDARCLALRLQQSNILLTYHPIILSMRATSDY